jgi:hypothetical protein
MIQKSHIANINLKDEILSKESANVQAQNQRNEPLSPKKSQSNLLKHLLVNRRASDSWASLPALEPKEEIEEEVEEEKSETIKKPEFKRTASELNSFTDLTENYLLSESESDDEDSDDEDHPEILQFLHK